MCNTGATPEWGSTRCGDVSTRGTTVVVPVFLELQICGRIPDPGMGSYPTWVTLAHAGSMAGIIPLQHQPSRKSQQPLAWTWPMGTSREVNEAMRPHTCSRPCAIEEEKKSTHIYKKKNRRAQTQTTKSTAARRSRPPRNGRATTHARCVSPYSLASTDPGFMAIGLVQLSQSVKTTNVSHTLRHRLIK